MEKLIDKTLTRPRVEYRSAILIAMPEPFTFAVHRARGGDLPLSLAAGEQIFILGANGTGKSTLAHQIYRGQRDRGVRISAHRQTWFVSDSITISPHQKQSVADSIRSHDGQADARWREHYSEQRANLAIYELIDAENVRARSIAAAVDADDFELAKALRKKEAPIKMINELLRLSNMRLELSVVKNEQILASKSGGPTYSITQLSDGERNAVLIAATVLTAREGSLIVVDEPERHLHRSIISPLLTQLFAKRPDCAFVVSTHEIMLAVDHPSAKTLLVRGCEFVNGNVRSYDADLLEPAANIDDTLKKDILGARSTVLFVEGTESSLDLPLYSLIFPDVSVVAKRTCWDVEHSVVGIRGSDHLHWIRAFGIVDRDGRDAARCAVLKARGIYAVPGYSVESIYYHPDMQRRVALRHASVVGGDVEEALNNAKQAVLAAAQAQEEHLAVRIAEHSIRERVMGSMPNRQEVIGGAEVRLNVPVAEIFTAERTKLAELIVARDVEAIIERYPIRETTALASVARALRFQDRQQYEAAVRKMIMDDEEARRFATDFFDSLPSDIAAA